MERSVSCRNGDRYATPSFTSDGELSLGKTYHFFGGLKQRCTEAFISEYDK